MASTGQLSSFCLAAPGSGSGKTTVALAIMRALSRRGLAVQPFKCGPDYIDPGFHFHACRRHSRNLDGWMMGAEGTVEAFRTGVADADCAVIEGAMGLFDSSGAGILTGSTAEISLLASSPVLLVVNVRGMAGSIAALVKGFHEFRPEIKIAGVIANLTGSERHADLLRQALAAAELPPLLGHFPRNECWRLPERHLGLVPYSENGRDEAWFDSLADAAEQYCDLDRILALTRISRPPVPPGRNYAPERARLAVAYDEAFHFYYRDNLDFLLRHGIKPVFFSPLKDSSLPENIAGIYFGGGFPEVFAEQLAANRLMKEAVGNFAGGGGFIYGECGGFMYMSESIDCGKNGIFPMCGIIPARAIMSEKLRSLGYRETMTDHDSPFGQAGTIWRGHEFHWSEMVFDSRKPRPLWQSRGSGGDGEWSAAGFHEGNIYGSYIHLCFVSSPAAASGLCAQLTGTTFPGA